MYIVKCNTPSDILFTIPKKEQDFSLWEKSCDEHVKWTRRLYYICANHFAKDDTVRKHFLNSEDIVVGIVSISYLVNI